MEKENKSRILVEQVDVGNNSVLMNYNGLKIEISKTEDEEIEIDMQLLGNKMKFGKICNVDETKKTYNVFNNIYEEIMAHVEFAHVNPKKPFFIETISVDGFGKATITSKA